METSANSFGNHLKARKAVALTTLSQMEGKRLEEGFRESKKYV